MGIQNFGGHNFSQDALDRHSRKLLEDYGVKACDAALKLENANISKGTARSYKPQVRQIISSLDSTNPHPRDVVEFISESDKKGSTKNIMIVAMKKYYGEIGEYDRGEQLSGMAKERGVAEIDFNRDMEVEEWITKSEVERIEEHILPPKGRKIHEVSGPDKSWVITLEHKALVMTLFYTGSRVGEICARDSADEALKVEDLNPDTDQIRLYRLKKQGKGCKRDMKVVPQKLWDVIDEYLNEYGIDEGPVFPFVKRTAQNRITDIHNAYEFAFGDFEHMDKLTPHKFRHGRITDIANHSGLEEAGQYVQHSSTEVTNAYRHLAAEQQRDILPEESEDGLDELDDLEQLEQLNKLIDKLNVDSAEEAVEKIDKLTG